MDVESLSQFTSIINAVGFPIFVAVFMLTKGTKDSQNTQSTIVSLTQSVDKLSMLIDQVLRGGKNNE